MKFHVTATINLPHDEEFEQEYVVSSLDDCWKRIYNEYPIVESVVLVFCAPDKEC